MFCFVETIFIEMAKLKQSKKRRNILVPTIEWQGVHPQGVRCKSDAYYAKLSARLANLIREMFGDDPDISDEEIKGIAIALCAYMEDKINGTQIWNSFMAIYREKFNRFYPFYDVEADDLMDDEPNKPDVRFLLWYSFNRLNPDTMMNPMNSAIDTMADFIYGILAEEYELAPESEEFVAAVFNAEKYDDVISIRNMCGWLIDGAYLTAVFDIESCYEDVYDIFEPYFGGDNSSDFLAYALKAYIAFNTKIGPLALTAPKWLGKILELSGDTSLQEIAHNIGAIKTLTLLPFEIKTVTDDGFTVQNLKGDVMSMSFDPLPEESWKNVSEGHIMISTLVEYDGKWRINGASSFTDKPKSLAGSMAEYEQKNTDIEFTYETEVQKNGGSRIGVAGDFKEFSSRFDMDMAENTTIDKAVKDMSTEKNILYFINTDSSISMLPERAAIVAIPGNPYYDERLATQKAATLLVDDNSTEELRDYLINENLLPDARLAGPLPDYEAKEWFAENAPFLAVLTHSEEVRFNMP